LFDDVRVGDFEKFSNLVKVNAGSLDFVCMEKLLLYFWVWSLVAIEAFTILFGVSSTTTVVVSASTIVVSSSSTSVISSKRLLLPPWYPPPPPE
jgi:hypothetical protein